MGTIKDTLDRISRSAKVRAAMPGHKGKIKIDGRHDVTELTGLDNLQRPQGMIRKAEEAAARIYGTSFARYLVNGSSCGNLTLIFSFFFEGDEILVERTCHKSVFNAIVLRKLKPVYLWPTFDEWGSSLPPDAGSIRQALSAHPEVKGIVLTLPSYKGLVSDFEAVYAEAKEAGVHLIIDAAHGAALAGLEEFDGFYTSCDAMVISPHKTLACLNQGAVILCNRPEYQGAILKYSNMFQTSSPSYLIMESIESSLEDVEKGLYLVPPDFSDLALPHLVRNPLAGGLKADPWKLLLYAAHQGPFMEEFLEEKGIYPEMHDAHTVLLLLSPFNAEDEICYVREILLMLDQALGKAENQRKIRTPDEPAVPVPGRTLLPWQAGDDFVEVSLFEAVGRTVQEQVLPYPPGVPVLLPGEIVSQETADYLAALCARGAAVLGLYDQKIRCLKEE